MKITILTLGSRGDVQPYTALGLELMRTGHAVRLVTDAGFESFVLQHGLAFAPLQADFIRLAQSPEGKAAMAGKGRLTLMKKLMPMLRQLMDDAWRAAQDSDAIVYHSKALAGPHIAEKLGIPGFLAMALPIASPTGAFAQPALGGGNYGSTLNRLSYSVFDAMSTMPFHGITAAFRRETLQLPTSAPNKKQHREHTATLYAYSRHVLPRPPEWGDDVHVTGCWFLPAPADWQPTRELQAFLEAGPPPVYVGFGSMAAQDAEATTRTVFEAVRRSGLRAVLATGWGGIASVDAPESAFVIDAAPHDWLFPRCSAVVHHGGAGTIAAGLRAGKPTVVVPFFGDQPFWGRRVAALGVGPAPLPLKQLTAGRLADALQTAVTDAAMRQRAQTLAALIEAENGVQNAAQIIAGG